MARHKIPSHSKELKNTDRADRVNPNEPKPTEEIGEPPKHLSGKQKDAWNELIEITNDGVLKKPDRIIVEIAAMLLAKMRDEGLISSERTHLISCLARMGNSPSDRQNVNSDGKKEDPWKKFGGKLKSVK